MHSHAHSNFTTGPLGWSAARRAAWALGFLAILWAAVAWALT